MVGPRRPLAKDPSLDYEEESDWEEEPEGENLSVRLPGNVCLILFDGDCLTVLYRAHLLK